MSEQRQDDECTVDRKFDLATSLGNLRSRPAVDPRQAAFHVVVRELLGTILREAPETRRKAVLDDSIEFIERALEAASGHETFGTQMDSLDLGLLLLRATAPPLDLRQRRLRRGPTDAELLRRCKELGQVLRRLLPRGRERQVGHSQTLLDLRREFGEELPDELLEKVAAHEPNVGARLIVAHQIGQSPDWVKQRLADQRENQRKVDAALCAVSQTPDLSA